MPSITQLEYIIAVDRFRHFSKAADYVHISQPTLSAQIQKAEEEVGIVIFDRNKKPLAITDQGKRFLEQAKIVVREHQKLIQAARSETDEIQGELRFAIIPTLVTSMVPRLIELISKQLPHAEIFLDEQKTPDIISALKDDRLDLALLATPLHDERIKESPVFYEPFFIFCSPGHPLTKTSSVTEKNLSGEDLWLLREGHCLRNQTISLCGGDLQRTLYQNIHFEGGSTESLVELVRRGHGYTLIPQLHLGLLTPDEQRQQVRPIRSPVPCREVSLVYRKGDWRATHFKKLKELIQSTVPKEMQKRPQAKSEVVGID